MPEDLNFLPQELMGVERALGALKPAAAALDRDRLMYEAGRVAERGGARGRLRIWQGMCVVLVLGCAGLALFPRAKAIEKQPIAHKSLPAAPALTPAPLAVAVTTPNAAAAFPGFPFASLQIARHSLDLTDWPVALGGGANRAGGGGDSHIPALRRGEGLDSLPPWQQKQVKDGGNRL